MRALCFLFGTSRPISRVLSWTVIYLDAGLLLTLKPLFAAHRAGVSLLSALLRIGFTGSQRSRETGELLPRLSTLTAARQCVRHIFKRKLLSCLRRYISVALSLRSPSAAVSRYPALRGSDFPQAFLPATVWPAQLNFIIFHLLCQNYFFRIIYNVWRVIYG